MIRRSMLFMPGNHPAMLLSADVLGADTVILDLEDAVSFSEKDSARILVAEALGSLPFQDVEVTVRINPYDTPYCQEDLAEIIPANPRGIVIPKACPEHVAAIEQEVARLEQLHGITEPIFFILIVESAYGLETLLEICRSSRRIQGILLGAEDFTADMEVSRTKAGGEIAYARYKVATVCKAFKLTAVDTPFTDVEDLEGLTADTAYAKSIGFSCKAAIHPRQVEIIHQVMAPTEAEVEQAVDLLEAYEEAKSKGIGVFSYQGKMVDLPIVIRAEKTVSLAKRLGLIRNGV